MKTLIFNPAILADILFEAPHRVNKRIKTIAIEMGGISDRYLARQINPDDQMAKLGVEEFVYFMSNTDLKPLDYINSVFDRVAIPISNTKVSNESAWLKHISNISKEAGEAISVLADHVSDGSLTIDEAEECKKEAYEALQALAALWVDLKRFQPPKEEE